MQNAIAVSVPSPDQSLGHAQKTGIFGLPLVDRSSPAPAPALNRARLLCPDRSTPTRATAPECRSGAICEGLGPVTQGFLLQLLKLKRVEVRERRGEPGYL